MAGIGACAMYLPAQTANSCTIRQSRPYHRYQAGKSMYMASAVNFGNPVTGQFQRVGFFDDNNGIFFEQGTPTPTNPQGMYVVVRSDTNYYPNAAASGTSGAPNVIQEWRVDYTNWSDPQNIKSQITWNNIQMIWVEYAWYGAGALRWGVLINGEQYILHEIGAGNNTTSGIGQFTPTGGSLQTGFAAWSRTGNLPVRYEQRDNGTQTTNITTTVGSNSATLASATGVGIGMLVTAAGVPAGTTITAISGTTITLSQNATATGTNSALVGYPATTFYHYGVSVIVEGRKDEQRGFTYSYGMNPAVPRRYIAPNTTRFPVLSIQPRVMGTQEFSILGGPATEQGTLASATTTSATLNTAVVTLPIIASITPQSSVATITFTKAHNLSTAGGSITISGATGSYTALNGTFTYTYLAPAVIQITVTVPQPPASQYLLLTVTSSLNWGINQFAGRAIYYLGTDGNYYTAKISANTANSLTFGDPVQQLPLAAAPAIGTTASATVTSGNTYVDVPNGSLFTAGQVINSTALPLSTKITSISTNRLYLNNATTATGTFNVVANSFFSIGQINRGQLLPQSLLVSADSLCVVELIASTPNNPVNLIGSDFQPVTNYGSYQSFGTRDVSATSIGNNSLGVSSGEVVYAFTTPAGGAGLQSIDLTNFFPLYNTILGNIPDILTVAITTKATQSAGILINSVFVSGTTATATFVSPHGLNAGDQIVTVGFTPSGLNGTFTITATPDAYKAQFTVAYGTGSATTLGTSTFSNGANVGAHLICQEAMS